MPGPFLKLLFLGLALIVAGALGRRFELGCVGDEVRHMDVGGLKRGVPRLWRTTHEEPPRGAVARIARPGKPALLSRVVGVPGDDVAIEVGVLQLNGHEVTEVYADRGRSRERLPAVRVPAGHVFVLNDARDARGSREADSRRLGPVPQALIEAFFIDERAAAALAPAARPRGDAR